MMCDYNKTEEQILKEQILDEGLIQKVKNLFGGKSKAEKKPEATKVYKQIAGLMNLGKTYFWNLDELEQKRKQANDYMVQRYGAEIYGLSAQQKDKDRAASSGLIECSVSKLADLTNIKKESSEAFSQQFQKKLKTISDDCKNNQHKTQFSNWWKKIQDDKKTYLTDSPSDEMSKLYDEIDKYIEKNKLGNDSDIGGEIENLKNIWKNWTSSKKKNGGREGNDVDSALGQNNDVSGKTWCPKQVMRITITTNYNENWYKNKFKSGFLNKAIDYIKTQAYASGQNKYGDYDKRGKKYSQDVMTDEEKAKLDKIKWKMTNNVTKDYIQFLLGWSREKTLLVDSSTKEMMPKEIELKKDDSFGKEMAKKALGNRGILGRLKQKLFANSQSTNTISVAFQMADPYDGWKEEIINKDEKGEEGGKEGGEKEGEDNGNVKKKNDANKKPNKNNNDDLLSESRFLSEANLDKLILEHLSK